MDFEDYGSKIKQGLSRDVTKRPSLFCFLLTAVNFALGPTQEVIITGNHEGDDTKAMLNVIHRLFLPNIVVVVTPGDETHQVLLILLLLYRGISRSMEEQRHISVRTMSVIDQRPKSLNCNNYFVNIFKILPLNHRADLRG